jgi:acetoin utilization protein AcuB
MKSTIQPLTSQNLKVVHWAETIGEAANRMVHFGIRHLPVVDDLQHIVGVISERDVRNREDQNELVRARMHREILTIEFDSSVATAAQSMVDEKVSSLLVLRDGYVVGIITSDDLLRMLAKEQRSLTDSIKSKIESRIYNSPIGAIMDQLANVGV